MMSHCRFIVDFLYCVCFTCRPTVDMQIVKQFIVPKMTFNGRSRSSTMSPFIRSPGLSIRDRKTRLQFSEKIAEMTLKNDQSH